MYPNVQIPSHCTLFGDTQVMQSHGAAEASLNGLQRQQHLLHSCPMGATPLLSPMRDLTYNSHLLRKGW